MRKILLSVLSIGVVAVLAFAASRAFFSDTEVSRNNTFTAGAIDLTIDNESWYHGPVGTVRVGDLSWEPSDLEGHLFFNFQDIKPGDWGEDTISIHVNNNDAYVCADFTLTSNEENTITEPEADMGDDDSTGELAGELNFVWWADDEDNVFEGDESVITQANLGDAWLNQTHTVTLADSLTNVWLVSGPILGETTYHIGKFWCFGEITENPVPENTGVSPVENPGFLCNGEPVSNVSQTDSATMDVGFYAVQSRHNTGFTCAEDNRTFLRLENKDIDGSWDPYLNDGVYGELIFLSSNPTFQYTLDVYGLVPGIEYSLIYYADGWPGNHPGALIGTLMTDIGGDASVSDDVELGIDLPTSPDTNYPTGAKIWVVKSSNYNPATFSIVGWPIGAETLFEWNLVTYDDTDIP